MSSNPARPPRLSEIPLAASDGLRWAVGRPDACRSATWRFWGNKKGDFYLAVRSLGGSLKTSFHKDGRCHTGLTSEYAKAQGINDTGRHFDRWKLPDQPLVQALEVVTPWTELTAFVAAEKDPMEWLPTPRDGYAAVVTVFIVNPHELVLNNEAFPGQSLGHRPLGIIKTAARTAFLTAAEQEMSGSAIDRTIASKDRVLKDVKARGVEQSDGLVVVVFGETVRGPRFLLELAYCEDEKLRQFKRRSV